MAPGRYLVVTSVAEPTANLRELATAARRNGVEFILVGDEGSPATFEVEGCDFYSLERQRNLDFKLAKLCPAGHYARKNIGYLLALQHGADTIVETDDDTVAYEEFWHHRSRSLLARAAEGSRWVNVYRYFSGEAIWPRGFPLDEARADVPRFESLPLKHVDAPIQQGLVNDDPDVDAVYRLVRDLPFRFDQGSSVALARGSWCPFNSQNTTWWRDAFPLMYLPATCSFRMTDIWRSFVGQRIAWANDWSILFHAPTVSQRRNEHDLMRDFRDEVVGYLDNRAICDALRDLAVLPGPAQIPVNMRRAYELLVGRGWLDEPDLILLDAWLADVGDLTGTQADNGLPAATARSSA